ncbi:uncharacterized protein [Parasteatoda tepidariorum]|uniref:uncharacterized protein n=1 Tax=Parasteatoda tepidariorum TaxID=114398 RepID=UPI001C719245|nr:ATP-dependent RNA helicase DEAH12, chloroplastic [Parasteatoda tepidariorum]XP_015923279.2 ATP-dependent RNA helicase DEAH12, chloroplastic [Parasteatoda tepidariorum]
MSSREQNRKPPGQGRGNQNFKPSGRKDDQSGKSNKNPNQSKDQSGKSNKNPNQSKASSDSKSSGQNREPQRGNPNKGQSNNQNPKTSGKKDDSTKVKVYRNPAQQNQQARNTVSKEEQHQSFSQKKTSIKIGFNNPQHLVDSSCNILANKSSAASSIFQLAANALTHLSFDLETTTIQGNKSLSYQSNTTQRGRPGYQNRGNRRGRGRVSINTSNPPRAKSNDSPAEIRVFSGRQEPNRGTAKIFRGSRPNYMPHRFNKLRPHMPQNIPPVNPTFNSHARFMSPNQTTPNRPFPPTSTFMYPNQTTPNRPFPPMSTFTSPGYQEQLGSLNTGVLNSNSQVKAPIFKKKKSKSAAKISDQTSNTTYSNNQPKPVSRARKRQQRRQNMWKKSKTPNPNQAAPLLSFQRVLPSSEGRKHSISSEEDDATTLSRCSSVESVWTTTVSDDAAEASSSDESEVTSEISMTSSYIDSGITSYASDVSTSIASNTYKVIAYYWDIENCPVPHKKSPTDFVKRIRETFNAGRTEFEFFAVCDVTRLSNIIAEELDRASVNMMHVSFTNKNAADNKIKTLLQEFPDKCRTTKDSAIVLISGDSDFADTLNSLRYKHHIYIYLICKKDAKHSLIEAANEYQFYDNFVCDLPTRDVEKKKSYLITLYNFPDSMKSKQIKSYVNGKIKNLNCRIRTINGNKAEISFPNEALREKALEMVKNLFKDGKEIHFDCSETETGLENSIDKNKATMQKKPEKKPAIKKETVLSKESESNTSMCRGATLCVFVSVEQGNMLHWKNKFKDIFDTTDFELKWDESGYDGYFLIFFESISKAQKAKKLLQKNQEKDVTSPKFLKLIKGDDVLGSLNSTNKIQEINKQKLDEQIRSIESKRESCLKKHKEKMSIMKAMSESSVLEAAETITEKYNELNEQKVCFLNFTTVMVDNLKKFDVSNETVDKDLGLLLKDYNRECNSFLSFLPIYAKKNLILKKIRKHQVVIIRAETGSGKSTQLAQYLWREQAFCKNGLIICTQPRKIAAIALAKHVSTQIGCSLGDIVGYQVGSTSKKSPNTGILFVTDITMLKMMVNDELKNVSCIIVDEAHERTVYTDLLLGMIKSCLDFRPQLKLIITSATIDTSIFVDYFKLQEDNVLNVSGRTFPVEDVWLDKEVALGWDYFPKAISTVCDILDKESEGDILVFLTTPFETEKAMNALEKKLTDKMKQLIQIYQLHGRLDVTEQQKVFERLPKEKRKIVFATNCAETSITIPGIKYVVDCGFVKESQYDAIRNMNVMAINFVSQSSSEQRRGRAGRTQAGKCYHLYSKSNFDKMIKNSAPEILRCNLGNAMLKLMKIGVKNPTQFDYVQSPPRDALELAMKQLKNLKAVTDDFSLTLLGEKISCLPLEPRLGHLVFDGIDNDIGFEAVVMAALVTVSRNIFFRTSENREEADLKKMQFCQSESDFITFFDIYKEWAGVPKQAKNRWCVVNCINARSMRTAQDLVNEIIQILQTEVQVKVLSRFKEVSVHNSLLKIIFRSFYQNLCIFSGHTKFGYKSLDIPDNLMIHPSSSLFTFGNKWRPQYLVYDSVLKTDKTYLLNVSPASDDLLVEFQSVDCVQLPLEELELLTFQTYSVYPVGKIILSHDVIGKKGILKRNLEDTLKKSLESDSVVIDVDFPNGEIKVCAPQSQEDCIQSVFSPLISRAQERLFNEEKEVSLQSSLNAIISAGALIKYIIFPGEFRELKVFLKDLTEMSAAVEKLQTCGKIDLVLESKNYFKVTFSSPDEAKAALEHFKDDNSFRLQKVVRANSFYEKANQYKLRVTFLRRKCTGVAFVTVDTPTFLPIVLDNFKYKLPQFKNSRLSVSQSSKTQDIRIQGLPYDAEQYELRAFLSPHMPEGCKISKCIVARENPHESVDSELMSTKQKILNLFTEFTPKEKISIDLKKASSKDSWWHAFVCFENCREGEAAYTTLMNRKYIPDIVGLKMKPMLQSFLYTKLDVFNAVKPQIEEALEFFKNNSVVDKTLEITVVPKGEHNVQILITSNNISDITDARKAILNFLLGDAIHCEGNENLEKLFSREGLAFLKQISNNRTNFYVEINIQKKVVTLFGNESVCSEIKIEIQNFLEKLEDENIAEISLMPESCKPGVLQHLLKNYGHNLDNLKEICCLTCIEIDIRGHVLHVRGRNTAISKCQDIVNGLLENCEETLEENDEEDCPVCFMEIDRDQCHRLEYCGHAYCSNCLVHLFLNSDDYPLCCISCGAYIVLADLDWAIKEVKVSEADLLKKSLQAFIQSREDIGYCPSPDCPMIYRVTEEGTIFECPACNNAICTTCGVIYHYGMSCSLYQCSKGDVDYPLKVWMENDSDNRKECPFCSSPIEKNGGCSHMICWSCKSHLCWDCLQIFLTSDLVYNHQPSCPKRSLTASLI